mmetsp:Transcript_20520/g.37018  ORF Transcript_20520/g.37018 Transcript_20520/m.37018 type:complete len:91 (+) Transcript_20520:54-326(+)
MNKQIVSNTVTMDQTKNSKKLFPLHIRKQPEKTLCSTKALQKISINIIHISNMRISALSGKAATAGENLLLLRSPQATNFDCVAIVACVN